MTTIVGVTANKGMPGIVIGSDTQISFYTGDGEMISKRMESKLLTGKEWVLAYAGTARNEHTEFQRALSSHPQKANDRFASAVERARKPEKFESPMGFLKKPDFPEIAALNATLYRHIRNTDDFLSFILATRGDKMGLGLWQIDPFGYLKSPPEVHEFEYVTLGSGASDVEGFIDRALLKSEIDPTNITIPRSIEIVVSSLEEAEHDAGSNGLDYVVVTKEDIDRYGDQVKKAERDGRQKVVYGSIMKYRSAELNITPISESG